MGVGQKIRGWGLIAGLIGSAAQYAAIALPDANPPESPVMVAPQLDALNFYARTWQCERRDTESSETVSFQWSVTRELNNLWFLGEASTSEKGLFARETLGYNTIMQKFGRTVIGDDGTFGNFLSSGWEGNTLIWEGRVSNLVKKQIEKRRLLVIKVPENGFTEIEERATMADGESPARWMRVSMKQCLPQ